MPNERYRDRYTSPYAGGIDTCELKLSSACIGETNDCEGAPKEVTDDNSAYKLAVPAEASDDRGTWVLVGTANVDGELESTENELSVFDILLEQRSCY